MLRVNVAMPKFSDAYEFIVARLIFMRRFGGRALWIAMLGHEAFKPRIADMRDIDAHRGAGR